MSCLKFEAAVCWCLLIRRVSPGFRRNLQRSDIKLLWCHHPQHYQKTKRWILHSVTWINLLLDRLKVEFKVNPLNSMKLKKNYEVSFHWETFPDQGRMLRPPGTVFFSSSPLVSAIVPLTHPTQTTLKAQRFAQWPVSVLRNKLQTFFFQLP